MEPTERSNVYIVVFDLRAHSGANVVGPFKSKDEANAWASKDTGGGTAIWEVWTVEAPND